MIIGNCDRQIFTRALLAVMLAAKQSEGDGNPHSGVVYLASDAEGISIFTVGMARAIRVQIYGTFTEGQSVWSIGSCEAVLKRAGKGGTLSMCIVDRAVGISFGDDAFNFEASDITFNPAQIQLALPVETKCNTFPQFRFCGWMIIELGRVMKALEISEIDVTSMKDNRRSSWQYENDMFIFDYIYISPKVVLNG